MQLSPGKLIEHAKSPDGRKQLRYLGVSLVFVPVGQILLQIFGRILGSYTAASLVSVAILTLPNFFANKYFVWRLQSKDNLRTQILVFWVSAMLGAALATSFTWWVEQLTKDQTQTVKGIAAFFAQCMGFGLVWVGRYLILDKWLFKVTHHGDEPTEEEIEDLHHDFPI